MLGLHCETNSEWIERVSKNLETLLSDHAHCEKKAATMAISLLNRYPDRTQLVSEMVDLAIEEMNHLRMVIRKMTDRGLIFGHDSGDNYVQTLNNSVRKQEPQRLLDKLIISSLIEARSCERFQLLAERVEDHDLKEFYRSLLASEAKHRNTFLSLARSYFSQVEVSLRLSELESIEAELVSNLPSVPLMHG